MSLPWALLCSALILAWGAATSRLALSGAMAALFLALSAYPVKIALSPKAQSRLNEASFLLVLAGALWFWLIRQSLPTGLGLHYVSMAPLFLYPRLLARAVCAWDPNSLSFNPANGVAWARHWAERARGGEPRLDRRSPIDFHIPYALLCAFSCSVSLSGALALAASAGSVVAVGLARAFELSRQSPALRSRAAGGALACVLIAAGVGAAGGFSLNAVIEAADGRINSWFTRKPGSGWSTLMADTSIGKRGNAEMSARLLYRLEWSEGSGYLRRGVYPLTYDGTSWQTGSVGSRSELSVFPGADQSFALPAPASGAPAQGLGAPKQAKISGEISSDRLALPLPIGATDLFGLPASRLNVNAMNAVSAVGATGFASFGVLFNPQRDALPPAEAADFKVPEELLPAIDAFIEQAGLRGLPAKEAAERLKTRFANGWSYTLRLSRPDGQPRSIPDFLLSDRQGHCEYFASAGTLIMRRLGFPARYASGFLVHEFDASEQAYWIRTRDSHAWLHYWDGERWALLDPTVAGSGQELEASDHVSDFFARLQYRLDQFDVDAALSNLSPASVYPIGALLALFLGYKIARAKKIGPQKKAPSSAERLVKAVELWCSIERDPRESASVFWRRAAPLTPVAAALERAANARELALFAPAQAGAPQDEALIQEALRQLARAKKRPSDPPGP